MRKLNRKGFTLIELLAVIVILAVVMGIAITSVLSSMNKARAGAIGDTALIVANAFNQAYTEALVDGSPSDVFGDVLGTGKGYDFTGNKQYTIVDGLADKFGISTKTYILDTTKSDGKPRVISNDVTETSASKTVTPSYVIFDSGLGKFTVCMSAAVDGPNYVNANAKNVTLSGGITTTADTMMACSDGKSTWETPATATTDENNG